MVTCHVFLMVMFNKAAMWGVRWDLNPQRTPGSDRGLMPSSFLDTAS